MHEIICQAPSSGRWIEDGLGTCVEEPGQNIKNGLIDYPNVPLEQAYLSYKWVAN